MNGVFGLHIGFPEKLLGNGSSLRAAIPVLTYHNSRHVVQFNRNHLHIPKKHGTKYENMESIPYPL
jgi:hypothetical protein